MQADFDFDLLSRLAQEEPAAFEAHRQALLAAALEEAPAPQQLAARVALAHAQVRMAAAPNPASRLAVAFSAMGDSMLELQQAMGSLRSEVKVYVETRTATA